MAHDAPASDWYKDAVIYELHVKAFYDSNGDGFGDFAGLTERLDYLVELGVDCLWLLPFYPSPLRDDGYDIADYYGIHPSYGTMADFERFLEEAHARGLRVITELVINHTSDQHPWFQRALAAPQDSNERDFYVWTDEPTQWSEARVIFFDYEPSNWTWEPKTGRYYWHRFYAHQPDLNFRNPAVHDAIMDVVDFWFAKGVDGMRLDAIPYLYEEEGTNCENLPETHAFLRDLRQHVDERYPDRVLLAEANQPPADVASFFGTAEEPECHMAFHFPLMPRLYLALLSGASRPIESLIAEAVSVPPHAQWATFLRNHDELTLEMVSDEERDRMYAHYAPDPEMRFNAGIRRRLAPLLGNDRRSIELMYALLLTLPGSPVLYYGDEIGMGDSVYLGDRHGVRTPMQWSEDRNGGFSRALPEALYLPAIEDPVYGYRNRNVERARLAIDSLYVRVRALLKARRRVREVFGRGSIRFIETGREATLAYVREHDGRRALVVANLNNAADYAELDLSDYAGQIPVELLAGSAFPTIGELPFFLTFAPHGYFVFELTNAQAAEEE